MREGFVTAELSVVRCLACGDGRLSSGRYDARAGHPLIRVSLQRAGELGVQSTTRGHKHAR